MEDKPVKYAKKANIIEFPVKPIEVTDGDKTRKFMPIQSEEDPIGTIYQEIGGEG